MDAPERIWLDIDDARNRWRLSGAEGGAAYIRADIHEALQTELAEVTEERDCAQFAERNAESLSSDAIYAVRELLKAHDVPTAAFIDDHVGNAIAQRDEARSELAAEREKVERLEKERDAYHESSFEAAKEWMAAWLAAAQTAEQAAAKNGKLSLSTRPIATKAISALCKEIGREIRHSKALATALAAEREACAKVVMWAVKDYADGWIPYQTEEAARRSPEAQQGALVAPLYVAIRARGGRDE